jgi:transglutaminase-like putative cysteine protease
VSAALLLSAWIALPIRALAASPAAPASAGMAAEAPGPSRASGSAANVAETAIADTAGPAAVLNRFDSLMEAGKYPEARRLCAGQLLRMFDFIVLAQSKFAGYVDTARSKEEILEEKVGADWAYEKVHSRTYFKKPFLGQDSLVSIQVAHLYRSRRGWLVAEMEELERKDSPARLRTGVPEGAEGGAAKAPAPELFPVSARAPERPGEADRIRYRLRLKGGGDLAGTPVDASQKRIRADSPSDWLVEVRKRPAPRPDVRPPPPDTARLYLASNEYLDLKDTLLTRTAAGIAAHERIPSRIADSVYRWVVDHFRFRMGSVLFGNSRETLRGLTGDCSEAAILTAALLRARGVPARVALGFASLGKGVFIGHAWCEAWLDGDWMGVDAALREFPAGAERIKLAELDGRGDMRIAATNLMMRMIGNLDLQIVGAWKRAEPLKLRAYPDNSAEAGRFFQDILDGIDEGEKPK